MAGGDFGLLCLLAVFSFLQRPGCCQYQQIVLGDTVTCNMSTIYSGNDGESLTCTGAINDNIDTHWYPKTSNKRNCVFTASGHWPAYWFLNLGQTCTIHRITIYHVQYQGPRYDYTWAMRNVQVSVEGREVFTYPDDTSRITNPTRMTFNFPVTGQIIKIERTTQAGDYYLPLCEVQLWECERHRYGNKCANTCNANCQDNGRDTICNGTTGTCIQGCVNAWYGPQCTSACVRNCEVCDRDSGACTKCNDGMYGNTCDKNCNDKCSPDNKGVVTCALQTGTCDSGCVNGWYDTQCTSACVRNCEVCDRDSGACTRCKAGWHGNLCDIQCSDKCRPDNKDIRRCLKENGRCTTGCVAGWHGSVCDTPCSDKCSPDNNKTVTCEQDDGRCSSGCVNGWYGPQCTSACVRNCQVCDRDSGVCTRCVAGWHDNVCDTPCSDKCSPDNNKTVTCEQDDGRCSSGCVNGWYGPQCTTACVRNCEVCDRDSGACTSCVRGYYGVTCQFPCGKGCVNNNCSRQDGACTCLTRWSSSNCTECDTGYYGVESCEECGYCRDGDVCNNHNGHCPRGCRDGFDVDLCNRCAIGYYGVRCHLLCGKGCVDNNCSRQDGACTCLTGWSPPYCVVTASESSGGDIVGPVVGSVLGAGALIGLSILLAAIIRRQRSRDAPTSRDSDERREAQFSPEDAQARVDTEGLKTLKRETSDADTHYESLEKYENPDDMKPYSTLETDHGRLTNVNIQGDKEAVLYQNITGYKT